MEPAAKAAGEEAVAHGGGVGDGGGRVFEPFFESAAMGGDAATAVFVAGVEHGGGDFDGEELVAEKQRGGRGAGGAGNLPGGCDVGGGGGTGFRGGFGSVAEVDSAVEAGFRGDDAFGGEADTEADGEVEGDGGSEERGEAGIEVEAVGGGVVNHAGMMADGGRDGKRKIAKMAMFCSILLYSWDGGRQVDRTTR